MLAASPRYKWWVVLMLWTICVFNYADRQAELRRKVVIKATLRAAC